MVEVVQSPSPGVSAQELGIAELTGHVGHAIRDDGVLRRRAATGHRRDGLRRSRSVARHRRVLELHPGALDVDDAHRRVALIWGQGHRWVVTATGLLGELAGDVGLPSPARRHRQQIDELSPVVARRVSGGVRGNGGAGGHADRCADECVAGRLRIVRPKLHQQTSADGGAVAASGERPSRLTAPHIAIQVGGRLSSAHVRTGRLL